MPPKRKAPLETTATNVPAAKKTATGKSMAEAGPSAAAAVKKYNYSDPSSFDNQTPAEITFFMFPEPESDEDDDDDDDDDDDNEDSDTDKVNEEGRQVNPDSLQYILDTLEKERAEAVYNALNPPEELIKGGRSMTVGEARQRIAEASIPYQEKMDEARQKFVTAGTMTAEEAKAIVPAEVDGPQDYNKKSKKSDKNKDKAAKIGDSAPPRVVTDDGFPVTQAGIKLFFELNQEVYKRDQDSHNMHIYNDFSGYGVTEVLENMLSDFNDIIFKKHVSPLKKWALVEGLTIYLEMGDHMSLMMSNDSDGNREVFEMMGVMFITALDMLHESSLIGPVSPLPDNIGLMTLFFLDFMTNTACDFDMNWVHEVVRAADTHGVTLNPLKQIEGVDQGTLDDLRLLCRAKKGKKLDWKAKYAKFKKNHSGGDQYDITKMSKKEKAKYTFGTKECEARMSEFLGEDSDDMSGSLEWVSDNSGED